MIERKIVNEKMTEFLVEEFLDEQFNKVGHSHTEIQKTPVGEKIIIHAARPGLIVGARGANIKKLTRLLKSKFKLENPQVDIIEVKNVAINADLVAENIAYQFERFGSQRFKAIGYRAMDDAMRGGAMGIEILISGKIPSTRARTWRFYTGYLKKSGDLAVSGVLTAYSQAKLKTGVIGIQVRIMPGDLILPDKLELIREMADVTAQVSPDNIIDAASNKPRGRDNRKGGNTSRPNTGKAATQSTDSQKAKDEPAPAAPLNLKDALKAKKEGATKAAAKKVAEPKAKTAPVEAKAETTPEVTATETVEATPKTEEKKPAAE